MGNRVTNTLDKWGINPRRLSLKRSTRKAPPAASRLQSLDPHIYDNVAVEPEYAKVRKKRTRTTTQTDSDGLHYAEIQVLQSESSSKQKTLPPPPPPKNSSTEYATIDFLRGAKPKESAEPADLFIPPGELRGLMVKSQKKKRFPSQRAVMV